MTADTPAPCVILFAAEADDRSRQVQLLALADRLNKDGIDTEISLYHSSPPEGWNVWMERMAADRTVLTACTELYRERFELNETSGGGGVTYEARIVRERLKAGKGLNSYVIPFVLEPADCTFIPRVLKDVTAYDVSNEAGYEALYARLTGREIYEKPPLGQIRPLRMPHVDAGKVKETVLSADDAALRAEVAVALERLLSAMRRTSSVGSSASANGSICTMTSTRASATAVHARWAGSMLDFCLRLTTTSSRSRTALDFSKNTRRDLSRRNSTKRSSVR